MHKFYNFGIYLSGLGFVYSKASNLIRLENGQSLLDVGCGTGTMLKKLRGKYGKKVNLYGIDPDSHMLEVGREKTKKLDIALKIAYASDLPFVNGSVDWVISTLAFHHMPPNEKVKAIEEMTRVLKPGGKLLISDLGRPKGIVGLVAAKLSSGHSFTAENMQIVEENIIRKGFSIEKRERTLGWIEHILATRPS